MKIKILLSVTLLCCLKFISAQPGTIDTSFGKSGVVRTDIGTAATHNSTPQQVLTQADGSIFIVFQLHIFLDANNVTLIGKKRPDGSPDSSYGHYGFSVSVKMRRAHAAMQSDGKIIVAGTGTAPLASPPYATHTDFIIARYNTDGSLDRTFGTNGKQLTDFDGYHIHEVRAVNLQRDGKIVVSGFSGGEEEGDDDPGGDVKIFRYNPDGSLDNTFGDSGIIASQEETNNILTAIQTNGKIIAAIWTLDGFSIKKYNADGSADSSFNSFDIIKRFDSANFNGRALAVQSDGKIVLGGLWASDDPKDFVIVRLNTNGSRDKTFGEDGIQTTDFRGYNDVLNAIAIQTDGKIVAAGYASNGSNNAFAIARYNTNGSLDNTFDSDGKKMNFITSNNVYATSLALQNNGKLVAVGYEESTNEPYITHIALVRYNTDGSLDKTLHGSGGLIDYVLQKNTVLIKTAVQKDGKIAAAGYYWNGTTNTYFTARYNTDGSLDNTFSSDGFVPTDFTLSDIKVQKDGKIIATGTVFNGNNNDFKIIRYNTNGSVDNTFSQDGKVTTDFGFNETANSAAIQNDGKIVIAGSSDTLFALARYNIDGSLDKSFSDDGKQTTAPPYRGFGNPLIKSYSYFTSADIQSDGKIVAAGIAYEEDDQAVAIARYNSDGSLDHTFSEDGFAIADAVIYDFGEGQSISVNSLLLSKDGKVIVAGYAGAHGKGYNGTDLFIVRVSADGSFDSTFSAFGTRPFVSPLVYFSRNASIALQANGKILIQGNLYGYEEHGYDNSEEVQLGYAVARLKPNGNFDSTFGINGVIYPEYDEDVHVLDIAIADNKLYTAGYSNNVSNSGFLTRFLLAAPFVKIISPAESTVYAAPATINVTAVASDEDGTVKNVKFYNNGIYLKTVYAAPYTYTITNLPVGNYTLTAKATDNTGLESISQPVKVSVLPFTANKAPIVTITAPANNAVYNARATFTLLATATDADGTVSTVKFYRGGTLLGIDSTSPYSYTVENVTSGYYSFTAKATDNKGLSGSSSSVTVAVSVPANKAPVVSIISPVNNVVFTAPATINITAATSDSDGSVHYIYFYNGGTFIGGIGSIYDLKTYTLTLTNVAPGTYSFVVKATDDKGLKSSSATLNIQVVAATNKAPTVSITSPAGNATYTAPATVTISAQAADEDGLVNSVKFYNGTTYLKTVFTSPYSYTLSNLAAGTYSLTAKATDNNGAQTTSAPVTVKVVNAAIVANKNYLENGKTALNDAFGLKLSPNPATNILNIYISGLQQSKPALLSIISVSGIVLKTMRISNVATQLDVSTLASGVYTIKIISGNNVLHKQFVKL